MFSVTERFMFDDALTWFFHIRILNFQRRILKPTRPFL